MATKEERIAFRASGTFVEALDRLSDAEDVPRAEVIRRAVALYTFALREKEGGRKLGFFTDEGGKRDIKEVVTL